MILSVTFEITRSMVFADKDDVEAKMIDIEERLFLIIR